MLSIPLMPVNNFDLTSDQCPGRCIRWANAKAVLYMSVMLHSTFYNLEWVCIISADYTWMFTVVSRFVQLVNTPTD